MAEDSSKSVTDQVKPESSTSTERQEKKSAMSTVLLLVSVFMTMFLVALDRTIISTVRILNSCTHIAEPYID
jgi:putative Ca2+/H+ antiporter (TMEM165/GDT1 family)